MKIFQSSNFQNQHFSLRLKKEKEKKKKEKKGSVY